jgi:endo-1,4-beta-xylanase
MKSKLIPILLLGLGACAQKQEVGLKDVFDYQIGTALSIQQIQEKDPKADSLVKRQFNVLTPENIMKSMFLQPERGKFDFTAGDQLIQYAEKNGMKVVGHTLVWHSQLPPYAHQITDKEEFRAFMEEHIKEVASHYDGKVQGWDVINEALEEDGSLRKSIFLNLLGEDYITDAFKLAAKYTPSSQLYYNDYNIEQPAKRAGAIRLIKKVQDAGLRIDGVGIQGHWMVGKVPFEEIEKSIIEYAALGLKVMITELDIEVLPRNFTGAEVSKRIEGGENLNPYKDGLPDSVQQQLASDYERLFQIFEKHKDKITRVTFWGVHDGQSWLNGWPVPGRTNYPLLFDRNYQPKPAYYKVMSLKNK